MTGIAHHVCALKPLREICQIFILRTLRSLRPILLGFAVSVLGVAGAAHASSHDYYNGKTVRFIVAFSAGG